MPIQVSLNLLEKISPVEVKNLAPLADCSLTLFASLASQSKEDIIGDGFLCNRRKDHP